MRFTTKTEYGLTCLMYMARNPEMGAVTVTDIAKQERFSMTYLQKIFQSLKASGIVVSTQGRQGGYALARPAKNITLKEIIEALEGHIFELFCEPETRKDIVCTHFGICSLKPVWERTKEMLDDFYSRITLEDLAYGGPTPLPNKPSSAKLERRGA